MKKKAQVAILRNPPGPALYGYYSAEALVKAVIEKNSHPETISMFHGKEVTVVDIIPPASLPEACLGLGVPVYRRGDEKVLYIVGVVPPYSRVAPLHVFDVGLRVVRV